MNAGIFAPPTQFADLPHDLLGRPTPTQLVGYAYTPDLLSMASVRDSMQFWLDATETQSLTLVNNTVAEWKSKVGGRTSTQAVANARPAYTAAGVNGRPAVLFDGVNDYLNTTLTPNDLTSGRYPTFAAVVFPATSMQAAVGGNYPGVFYSRGNTVMGLHMSPFSTVYRWSLTFNGTYFASTYSPPSPAVVAAPTFVVAPISNVRLLIKVNRQNAELRTAVAAPAASATVFTVGVDTFGGGSGRWFSGYVGEVLAWGRTLTAMEITHVENYFATKWAIAI